MITFKTIINNNLWGVCLWHLKCLTAALQVEHPAEPAEDEQTAPLYSGRSQEAEDLKTEETEELQTNQSRPSDELEDTEKVMLLIYHS